MGVCCADDCNDIVRKVQGLTEQQRTATTLTKDKQKARPDKITLQGLDTMAPDDIIAGGGLLERIFQDIDAPQTPHLGEDMFVMQTLDSSMDIHTPGRDSMELGSAMEFTPNPRAGLADIDFDAALTLDQPERFDAPEMEVDLPDMEGAPFTHTPEAEQEVHTRTPEQDQEILLPDAADQDMVPPLEGFETPPAEAGSEPKQAEEALQDAALQPEDMPLTPTLPEEDNPPAAAQGRRRGKRKTTATIIMDDPEHILLDRKVYREWTVNREPLLTDRPKRAYTAPPVAAFELLPTPCSGAWPADLLGMLQSRVEIPHAGGRKKRSKAEDDKMEYRPEAELVTMDIDQWLEDAAAAPGDAAWPSPEQHAEAQMDPLMDDVPGEDIPDEAELLALAEEEGLPVEQLRAAMETPQAAAEQLKTLQQGMASGSSKHSSLASLLARRARGSSRGRSSSVTKPAGSDKSLGSTIRRLSDVREDDAPVNFGMAAGDLDALLPALPEAEEPEPVQPGLLTQFQLLGDSLMEATERQTQPTQRTLLNKNTVAIMKALQQQFQAKEEATGASPTLSVDDLTAAMTKREAARIFYQICAVTSIGFVAADQEQPYGDILLTPGSMYSLGSTC
ncbi:g10948 [Coccomyxa viridis]|uniref:G10948 protein n=1 Tax=Coccomyxa viridis TaxID=1274662 RepID=A0ABP1G993_9CHLO